MFTRFLVPLALAAASPTFGEHKLTNVKSLGSGGTYDFTKMVAGIVNVLVQSIMPISAAVFITGALLYAGSFGKDNIKTLGKGMMIGSIVGLGMVLLSRGIMHLTLYFLYGDSI